MAADLKKKILIVIPRLPYPLNSGGRIAIFETIASLAKKYQLILVIIDDDEKNRSHLNALQKFSNDVTFLSKNRIWFILNAFKAFLTRKPLQIGYFYFPSVQKIINKKALEADLFFSFMIRTTSYGLELNIPKFHYAIDSMYLNYKKSLENTKSLVWKLIYAIEIPLLFKAEKLQLSKYNLTTFVNREEADFWQKYGHVTTLPHGIEDKILSYNQHDEKYKNVVSFIGRMDYQPNIEAVIWFCENVVPQLDTDIEFYIIGGFAKPEVINTASKYNNVKVLGFVEEPEIILSSCLCTVAPMQSGGGLQTKILMAMALESIVVSTSLPVGAIENAANGENIIIENDADRMAAIINNIKANPDNYTSIKHSARKLIETTYAISVVEKKLFSLMHKILL